MSADPLAAQLEAILRADAVIWPALTAARAFDLPDWWIVSGAIYNTIWNALGGHPAGYGIKDVDLFYFDPDTSWDAEDRIIQRGFKHFAPNPPVEIRNQARVHLWYEDHFGRAIAPLRNCRDSIRDFACETHAVGVRLNADDRLTIEAPFGLEAIFARRVVPNARRINRETHEKKGQRIKGLWPEVEIVPWPEISVIRADAYHDWAAIHDLLHRAFAVQNGRIDPPSSLHRLTAEDLRQKACDDICLLAHDGHRVTGCVFCNEEDDALYLGKLAVDPDHQGRGIGRALMERAITEARALNKPRLRLETRIELTENYQTFVKFGFTKTGETAHAGYDRPTSITMEREL